MFSYLCVVQSIVNELINNSLKGVNTYRWKDSTWLIFSEEYRWVIELTDGGTLWFNYTFFDNVLRYVSLNPDEGIKYITGWAEGYFFRKNDGWKVFDSNAIHRENKAVTVVNRGVKESMPNIIMHGENKDRLLFDHRCNGNNTEIWMIVEDGIKNTYPDMIPGDYNWQDEFDADKVIEYGVKV